MEPTYFTCTLGQAAALGNQQSQKTVNGFVDARANATPDLPAVAFPSPVGKDVKGSWTYKVYTFSDVRNGSLNASRVLQNDNEGVLGSKSTVALLCPSTPEFLFTWLALMRLGHAVLLIAPQCQAAAIKSLCDQCEVSLLLYDDVYAEQANDAASILTDGNVTSLTFKSLPFDGSTPVDDLVTQEATNVHSSGVTVHEEDVAYLHHTSGTSSGIPKPIPQPHRAAVGVLPSFGCGKDNATFTTTPLYHGGIADLLRAWTSGGLIWLFPGKGVPITATNIVKCLDIAASANSDSLTPPVTYFSSVPYVLQMLEADTAGLKYLQSMKIVGVGGAALPTEIGDRLVGKGVNLVSRFGSAECGFIMSSHRQYENDGEWQYLRHPRDSTYVRFEPREGNLGELVVLNGWPHMAKKNREDGAYVTADLFEPHASIEGAWKYHSRADSQLTLVTGKKFDPAPLEASIATSDLVEDALIFGNGQPYPGVLLFRSGKAAGLRDADFAQQIWPVLEKLNSESQGHARVSKNMVVPMPVLKQPLEKSSKGTVIRGAAEKRFSKEIDDAYAKIEGGDRTDVKDDELVGAVRSIVTSAASRKAPLKDDTDLFSYGIDSVAGMQIRGRLRQLLPADRRDLPITVVEDYGDINGIADYVLKRRHGQTADSSGDNIDEHGYMKRLIEQYSKFQTRKDETLSVMEGQNNASESKNGDVVVLTGATGALGAHILDQYRSMASVSKIYCLVRGADAHAAKERVAKALEQRKLHPLDDDPGKKVAVLPAHLADAHLGLDGATYGMLAREATLIMHVAWSVNFRLKLHSFAKDSIGGLSHLISLALAAPSSRRAPQVAFCSSVASVMAYPTSPIPEQLIDDPGAATELGYSRSKWVAEHVCARASEHSRLQGQVSIFRVGQLAGDANTGVWNAKEAWPLMLGSVKQTGALPNLQGEVLDWLPVDTAASALIQGARRTSSANNDLRVFHVVNPHTKPTWTDLLSWVQEKHPFETLPPAAWVQKLEALAETGSQHPVLQLLEHWKHAYANSETNVGGISLEPEAQPTGGRKVFALERTKEDVPALRKVEPVSKAYFEKLWDWIVQGAL